MIRRILAGCTLVALVATAGSLYFSEVANFVPCELCWYQRILMYPLVVVLGVAAYDGNAGIWKTGLPLSVLGSGVAAYHTFIQLSPEGAVTECAVGVGCTSIYWEGGPLTIPRLSLLAFLLITVGLAVVAYVDSREGDGS